MTRWILYALILLMLVLTLVILAGCAAPAPGSINPNCVWWCTATSSDIKAGDAPVTSGIASTITGGDRARTLTDTETVY